MFFERQPIKKEKIEELAKLLIEHSCRIKKGEIVIINSGILAKPLVFELYKQILKKGAYPRLNLSFEGINKIYYDNASEEQLKNYPKITEFEYKNADSIINIIAETNREELKNIDPKKIILRQKVLKPISDIKLKKKWVLFRWPTETFAKDAGMSFSDYCNFVISSCLLDWNELSKKMQKIKKQIEKTDMVRIISKNTDLSFSVKETKPEVCDGKFNMPDGEVFTTPLKDSVEGKILFDYPLRVMGRKISHIFLEFKKGKVVKFNSSDNFALEHLLKTDAGSSYLGEFGIGMNPKITKFTDELLFDEKITGTIHLALGNSYPETRPKDKRQGNESAIHADIVKELRSKKSKIFFDNKQVFEAGKWII